MSDDFAAKQGVPNAYGLIQGPANAIAAGNDSRRNEILNGIDRHRVQRINLLGHFHAAEFRGHRGACSSRHHERGKNRAEFPQKTKGNRRSEKAFRVEFSETIVALQTHDHSGENAGEKHDGKRIDSDTADMFNDKTEARRRPEYPGKSRGEEQKHPSHSADLPEGRTAELSDH